MSFSFLYLKGKHLGISETQFKIYIVVMTLLCTQSYVYPATLIMPLNFSSHKDH
jgi:hypothetical protein